MKNMTVEARIKEMYNCEVVTFFQKCVNQGMDTQEIAEMINCSVSNLRRIARKYKFTFYQPEPTPMLCESDKFKTSSVNFDNFLSRIWVSAHA